MFFYYLWDRREFDTPVEKSTEDRIGVGLSHRYKKYLFNY
jgi:hypothetical protein